MRLLHVEFNFDEDARTVISIKHKPFFSCSNGWVEFDEPILYITLFLGLEVLKTQELPWHKRLIHSFHFPN